MEPRQQDIHKRAEELAAGLPALLVAAQRVATTVSQGVHGRRRVGQGETFWQFRRYEPGDSTLRIDWRQSAKSQRVYLRETEWEAAQSVWLWRDGSSSMGYRSTEKLTTKAQRAELLLMALAVLLVRGGERVSLLGTGRRPTSGRAALARIASILEEGGRAGEPRPEASLPAVEPLPRYARLVLFGDLLSPLAEVREMVGGFASRGVQGHLVQVLDPAEESLPFEGRVLFDGMEDEGDVLIGRVESVRQPYRAAFEAHVSGLRSLAASIGWSYTVHRTDRPAVSALLALYLILSRTYGE
jgi:uncharacterized protein (DUF58 family)